MAEHLLGPLLLEHAVDAAGRDADDRPRLAQDQVGVLRLAPLLLGVLDQGDDPLGLGVVGGHPIQGHVEQAGIEVAAE